MALLVPRAAGADDALTLVSGSFPAAFYEVLTDVAQRAGFFRDEHLVVTEQFAGSSALAVQAVGSGKGDIAAVGTEPVIIGYSKGVRMVAFFSGTPHLLQVIGVLAGSPIRTLADLRGKTLGVLTLGQAGEVYTRVMLAGAGLAPGSYSFAPIGNGPQAIQALTSGRVDAAAFPLPELRRYEVTAHIAFRYFYEPVLKDVSDVAYVAAPGTIRDKGDALARFCRAMVKASIFVRVNPRLAARYFVEQSGGSVNGAAIDDEIRLLDNSQDLLPGVDPRSARIGEARPRDMKLLARFMSDFGVTPSLVPADAIVTDRFTAFANAFDHAAFIARVRRLR
jgi:NitT/TauT family transport system substrate-binding protein